MVKKFDKLNVAQQLFHRLKPPISIYEQFSVLSLGDRLMTTRP